MAGLGFAAVRDWVSWLRYEAQDDSGTPNPLGQLHHPDIYRNILATWTFVQRLPQARLQRRRRGRIGRKVFDGHMQWIAAGSGIGMNYRFSQSGRTERNRQDHLYAENLFPFANVRTTDPFTGMTR